MSKQLAFVGDVHGNLDALHGILNTLAELGHPHAIFLGDYLNKGPHSAAVLSELVARQQVGEVSLLAGNHETALLNALDTGDLAPFLKMGGATTIRSYLHRPVGPEVLLDFRAHLPREHVEALRAMPLVWESEDVIAQHAPSDITTSKFRISAHVPVGILPRITGNLAQLDTGIGSQESAGRLTALLWPSRDFVQVHASGDPVLQTS
jgi:serine/threonine protein phosphatase 1